MKTILIICCMLATVSTFGQKEKSAKNDLIQGLSNDLRLNQEAFYDISLNGSLKIKDLVRVDKDFAILESLGEPKSKGYKKDFAYERWSFTYDDLELFFLNQNGYIQIEEIKFHLKDSSQFKLGGIALNGNTRFAELVSSKTADASQYKEEVPIVITSDELPKNPFIHMKMNLEKTGKRVRSIAIRFETT